ncbi:MAG: hypothetical protein V4538_08460 [Bacteroidota bacterium]
MENPLEKITELLLNKSSTKQLAFRTTKQAFSILKTELKQIETALIPSITAVDKNVEVKYTDKGELEIHLKFSGDTLVFMMHTNVFDFDEQHAVAKSRYVQQDALREFCGLIQVYNFLSDSIKYNREADAGFLVARIFVNKENHFFVEGKKPFSFLYNDFEKQVFDNKAAHDIIVEAIKFTLNFDLKMPPFDAAQFISLEQKNMMSYSSGIPTQKQLGFTITKENTENNY